MEVKEKKYPVDAKDYKLYEEVGEGVSASVYRAFCIPFNEVVAIKVLDLERCNNDLDGIRREVHTMSLIDHPNVLRAHCSFTAGHNLWVVMPYMAGGSCLHIMKSTYPDGFEEPVIATLLHETLKALVYLHAHGHIHRDVKAGNILLDYNGKVKVADFGVSACMFDTGDRQRSRNTFVGTPCWMAPEVMQQLHGYDFKADIWSFGITALELAHGHAPFSKYPPMKVLLMTLQNAPPGLDYERDKRFSKAFKEMVAACLVKDPKKRPSSEKLFKHAFFKHAKSYDFLARTILDGLPPLGDRFRMLKAKEADLLVQNKALYGDKEQLSQQEYIRGISAWNFNLEDLKSQAALIQDDDNSLNVENPALELKQKDRLDEHSFPTDKRSSEGSNHSNTSVSHEDGFDDLDSLEGSLASFPIQPLQALKGCFDIGEDDIKSIGCKNSTLTDAISPLHKTENQQIGIIDGDNLVRSSSLPQYVVTGQKKFLSGPQLYDDVNSSRKKIGDGDRGCFDIGEDDMKSIGCKNSSLTDANLHKTENQQIGIIDGDNLVRSCSLPQYVITGQKKFLSGPLLYDDVNSSRKKIGDGDRDNMQPRHTVDRNFSGPISYRQRRDTNNNSLAEDSSEGAVVQRKGRFQVTSADVSPKGSTCLSSVAGSTAGLMTPCLPASAVLPPLQYILQQNNLQSDEIMKLIKQVELGNLCESPDATSNGISQTLPVSAEGELLARVMQMQERVGSLVDELQRQKLKNAQLERQLNAFVKRAEKTKD